MARNAQGLQEAITEIQALKKEFWSDVRIPGSIDEMNPELFKKVLDSNIYGATTPFFACLDVLKQTKGSVIFINSVAGLYGMPTASAYSAGKMALTAIQQSLRSELQIGRASCRERVLASV